MDARTKKFIEDLNSYLNTLYTLNYACLKAGARGNQNIAENKSAWLDEKMAILSTQRNNWISAIQGSVLDLEIDFGRLFYDPALCQAIVENRIDGHADNATAKKSGIHKDKMQFAADHKEKQSVIDNSFRKGRYR